MNISDHYSKLGYSVTTSAADDFRLNEKGEYVFDSDKLAYTHLQCNRKLILAMENGHDLVIQHNTNVQEWESMVLRSNANLFGYCVVYMEPEYAWDEILPSHLEPVLVNSHHVPKGIHYHLINLETILDMSNRKSNITPYYLGYFFNTERFIDLIVGQYQFPLSFLEVNPQSSSPPSPSVANISEMLSSFSMSPSLAHLPNQLHVTTDYIPNTPEIKNFSDILTHISESFDFKVVALFKDHRGAGVLIENDLPLYNTFGGKEKNVVPHITLWASPTHENHEIGYAADSLEQTLALHPNTPKNTVTKIEGFECYLFETFPRITGIFNAYYLSGDLQRQLSYKFISGQEQAIFFELLGHKTKWNENPIPALLSPDGMQGWYLGELKLVTGAMSDDQIYESSAFLRTYLTRGLCYLIDPLKNAKRVLNGLPKFSGMEDEAIEEQEVLLPSNPEAHASLFFKTPIHQMKNGYVVITEKANGEAAHVRFIRAYNGTLLLIGSKNVHLIIRNGHPKDIDLYIGDRYTLAKEIAHTFIQQYDFTKPKSKSFEKFMIEEELTAVYEYEHKDHMHIVPLYKTRLVFITFMSSKLHNPDFAMVPEKAIDLMRAFGFDTVDYRIESLNDLAKLRQSIMFNNNVSEGSVMYYIQEQQVNGLEKCKNASYILSRSIREKVCGYLKQVKKTLDSFISSFRSSNAKIKNIKDLIKARAAANGLIESVLNSNIKRLDGSCSNFQKKWVERINSIVNEYVPLNEESKSSWTNAGFGFLKNICEIVKMRLIDIVNEFKQGRVNEQAFLESVSKIEDIISDTNYRNNWPLIWKEYVESNPVITERDPSK